MDALVEGYRPPHSVVNWPLMVTFTDFDCRKLRQNGRQSGSNSVYPHASQFRDHRDVTDRENVDRFLRRGGLATAGELLRAGVSKDQLRRLARRGQVTVVARGVYSPTEWLRAISGDPRLTHAVAIGAIVRRNPDLVASHESAAFIHGLDILLPAGTAIPPLTLTRRPEVPSRSRVNGTRIRVATLPGEHVTRAYGLRVTTVGRTVMDIARSSGFMEGVVAADSALRSQLAIKADFMAVLEHCAQWRGGVQARRVMDFADRRAESVLESVARVRFAEYGLPPPDLQVRIRGSRGFIGRVDFCWHEFATIAEADGAGKYDDRDRARAQLARDEQLHDANWGTFHFTWRDIFHQPVPTIERLRRTFHRHRPCRSQGLPTLMATK